METIRLYALYKHKNNIHGKCTYAKWLSIKKKTRNRKNLKEKFQIKITYNRYNGSWRYSTLHKSPDKMQSFLFFSSLVDGKIIIPLLEIVYNYVCCAPLWLTLQVRLMSAKISSPNLSVKSNRHQSEIFGVNVNAVHKIIMCLCAKSNQMTNPIREKLAQNHS